MKVIFSILLEMNLDNNTSDLELILSEIQNSDNLLLNFASSRIASKIGKNDLAIQLEKELLMTNVIHFITLSIC